MSTEQNKAVVRRFIESIVNTGDVSLLAEVISPECRESADLSGKSVGLESMRAHVLGVRNTYPDLHITIERQIAEGDWVASQITARGTHLGEWAGIAPTGKPVIITGVNLDRVVGARIVEHGGAANMLEALLEVNAVQIVAAPEHERSGRSFTE